MIDQKLNHGGGYSIGLSDSGKCVWLVSQHYAEHSSAGVKLTQFEAEGLLADLTIMIERLKRRNNL